MARKSEHHPFQSAQSTFALLFLLQHRQKRALVDSQAIVVYTTIMQTDLPSLPLFFNRGTAFVIFAVAIFIVAAHTAIATMAAARL
jgi:hypothetical protein